MVALFLTAFDQQVNQREFRCELPSIEANFDLLNHIVAQGHTLVSACLIEDEHRTDLPLAAFDGLPVATGIQALEKEWQTILSQPRLFDLGHQQELIGLTQRRIKQYESTMRLHEQMIDQFSGWIQCTQVIGSRSTNQSWLLELYHTQLVSHQARLVEVRFRVDLAANRLSQLMVQRG